MLNIDTFLPLTDSRRSNSCQLWIAGCSIAHGFHGEGRVYLKERYGQLLSNALSLPVSFLTRIASSIPWAADQILRSDIKTGDTIIWGLTSVNRFMTYREGKVHSASLIGIKKNPALIPHYNQLSEQLISVDNLMYAVKAISQVENFCSKINAKLILFAHLNMSTVDFSNVLEKYLIESSNYVVIPDAIDTGDDNTHPGINTHKLWSDTLLSVVNHHD